MSKIGKAIRIHVPNQNWILEHGEYASVCVYSSTADMKNDQFSNEYIQVKAEVDGTITTCYVAVATSQNEAYEEQYSGWTINDNGVTKYVLFEPYLPDATGDDYDPNSSRPHTDSDEEVGSFFLLTTDTSVTRPSGSVTLYASVFGQVPVLSLYQNVIKRTRTYTDDGSSSTFYLQEFTGEPIQAGWWYTDYPQQYGVTTDPDYPCYQWECFNVHKIETGSITSTGSGYYMIVDDNRQFDFDQQGDLPAASQQPEKYY